MRHEYGTTFGPIGLPMTDTQAFALESLIASNPGCDPEPKRMTTADAQQLLADGDRSDISWISTEAMDRQKEVVLASGLDDSHYKMNPVVTLNHNYDVQPVGKSMWRKKVTNELRRGILAKTFYPPRPATWSGEWPSDQAFALIQSGLMCAKSVGFLTLASRPPTEADLRSRPEWAGCRRIVSKWLLLEYCCTWLPVNQEAIVAACSKSFADMLHISVVPEAEPIVPFLSLTEAKRIQNEAIRNIDVVALVNGTLDKRRGSV